MTFNAPFVSSVMTIEEDWIDYNGHLNMAFYMVLFDKCVDQAFALFGLGPDYAKARGASFYALEAHLTYLRELRLGDQVQAHLHLLDYDDKRTHFFQELYHIDQNYLAASCEQINMHIDTSINKAAPFPSEILEKIAAMHEAHENLERSAKIGHAIGIQRKPSEA